MNIDLFILQFVSVSAGLEGILIKRFCFIKNLLVAGQNVETVVDILGNIFQDGRGMIRHDVYIDGRVPGLSIGSVSAIMQG